MKITHLFDISPRLCAILERLLGCHSKPSLIGGGFMFIVKADNPDVKYTIAAPTSAVDSEGNQVPVPELTWEVGSDNTDAVDIVPDNDDDPLTGVVHFGAPGVASLTVTGSDASGKILASFGAQFTVTTGDISSVMGGTIAFEGLTEAGVE